MLYFAKLKNVVQIFLNPPLSSDPHQNVMGLSTACTLCPSTKCGSNQLGRPTFYLESWWQSQVKTWPQSVINSLDHIFPFDLGELARFHVMLHLLLFYHVYSTWPLNSQNLLVLWHKRFQNGNLYHHHHLSGENETLSRIYSLCARWIVSFWNALCSWNVHLIMDTFRKHASWVSSDQTINIQVPMRQYKQLIFHYGVITTWCHRRCCSANNVNNKQCWCLTLKFPALLCTWMYPDMSF